MQGSLKWCYIWAQAYLLRFLGCPSLEEQTAQTLSKTFDRVNKTLLNRKTFEIYYKSFGLKPARGKQGRTRVTSFTSECFRTVCPLFSSSRWVTASFYVCRLLSYSSSPTAFHSNLEQKSCCSGWRLSRFHQLTKGNSDKLVYNFLI